MKNFKKSHTSKKVYTIGYNPRAVGGFSIVEMLVVIAVLSILSTVVFISFRQIQNTDVLAKNAMGVIALYDEARTHTLASRNDESYGVYATSTYFVLFRGSSYNESDPFNKRFDLSGGVRMVSIELDPIGSEVVFNRLTGEALSVGTTTLMSGVDEFQSIVISRTGLVELGE